MKVCTLLAIVWSRLGIANLVIRNRRGRLHLVRCQVLAVFALLSPVDFGRYPVRKQWLDCAHGQHCDAATDDGNNQYQGSCNVEATLRIVAFTILSFLHLCPSTLLIKPQSLPARTPSPYSRIAALAPNTLLCALHHACMTM